MRQRWRSERANTVSAALINPPAPSLITSSGGLRPRWVSSSRKSFQASVDSLPPGASATNTGLPSVVMAQAASTGSARAPACILKQDPSKNR